MIIEHRVTIKAKCPVNDEDDYYNTLITVNRVVPVEYIQKAVAGYVEKRIYQEELTRELGLLLMAEVVTRGIHSGVYTTCRYDGRIDV